MSQHEGRRSQTVYVLPAKVGFRQDFRFLDQLGVLAVFVLAYRVMKMVASALYRPWCLLCLSVVLASINWYADMLPRDALTLSGGYQGLVHTQWRGQIAPTIKLFLLVGFVFGLVAKLPEKFVERALMRFLARVSGPVCIAVNWSCVAAYSAYGAAIGWLLFVAVAPPQIHGIPSMWIAIPLALIMGLLAFRYRTRMLRLSREPPGQAKAGNRSSGIKPPPAPPIPPLPLQDSGI